MVFRKNDYNIEVLAQYIELVAQKTGKNRKELGELFEYPNIYKFLRNPQEKAPAFLLARWVFVISQCLGLSLEHVYENLIKNTKYCDRPSRNFLSERRSELINSIKQQLQELEKQEFISN